MKINLFLVLGTITLNRGPMAYVIGVTVHTGISMLFALVHWAIIGMALGMMPAMHRGIRSGQVEAPGAYATGYPPMTTMGFLMLHLLYGILAGVFRTAFT